MSIEEVKKIALEKYGKDITDEQAAKYAAMYGKLSDDELDNVAGGCDSGGAAKCTECESDDTSFRTAGGQICGVVCNRCGHKW